MAFFKIVTHNLEVFLDFENYIILNKLQKKTVTNNTHSSLFLSPAQFTTFALRRNSFESDY